MGRKSLWGIGTVLVVTAGIALYRKPVDPPPAVKTDEYAAEGSCRQCHQAIAKSYEASGMARAFYRPTPQNVDTSGSRYFHAPSQRQYEAVWRDGRLIVRRWLPGAESDAFEMEAHYVIGSGNHAQTFLHRSPNGEITELPSTWYARERKWGMSPGFDKAKHFDFSRQIDHGCMFCHNSYPRIPDGGDRFSRIAVFPEQLPMGIDCQRCHGPGAEHIRRAGSGKANAKSIREAIVNPARLSPALQMDVCLQCHLETTSTALPASTRRFGRSAYSYRPGTPLTDFVVHFDHAPGTGHDGKFEIVGAAYRLRQSACFLKSEGKLTCTTCHDPHQPLQGEAALAHHRKQCLQCHTTLTNHAAPETSDCTSCHMPQRRTEDAVQVVMTDHRIMRRKPVGNLLAPLREKDATYRGEVVAYYPSSLGPDQDAYLGIAHSAYQADLSSGIAMLERVAGPGEPKVWASLGDAYMASQRSPEAAKAYAKALEIDSGMEKTRYNFAQALERNGEFSSAEREYQRLIEQRPGFADAHTRMGDLLARSGQMDRARAEYAEAIRWRSGYAEPHSRLGGIYLAQGKTIEARNSLEAALRIDPDLADAHNNYARLFASQGDLKQALTRARKAAQLDPANPAIRLNLGRLLYMTGNPGDAIAEFEALSKSHPRFAEAHLSLGIAYGEAGKFDVAIAEFEQVLRIQPDNQEARRNLDLARQMQR